MTGKDDAFLQRLLATFRIEAQEHIDALYAGLAELERSPDASKHAGLIETIFREAHSLKGAARSVSLSRIESCCQSLESTFSAMQRNALPLTTNLFDQIASELKQLDALIAEQTSANQRGSDRSVTASGSAAKNPHEQPSPAHPDAPSPSGKAMPEPGQAGTEEKPVIAGTVRIAANKLDAIFLQIEEMLAAKMLAQQRKQEIQAIGAMAASWDKEWVNSIARDREFSREMTAHPQWAELLNQNAAFIKNLLYQLNNMMKSADQDQRMLGRMVDDLLDDMKQVLMLPFSTILELFPRLVRDIAGDHGKEIDLVMQGGELEADRRILEAIKDPLTHLVRNCIDHGIEKPDDRIRKHKPRRGKIAITVSARDGNRVEVAVADDGAGINIEAVKVTARQRGLLSIDDIARLDEAGTVELIYQSGLSTSPIITEISGRGLGLAIVRDKINKLGGNITVETAPEHGTTFRIILPLTLATYRGIIVRIGEHRFVLPTGHVDQTTRIHKDDIRTMENRETIVIDNEILSLSRLGDVLGIAHQQTDGANFLQVALLNANGRRMAFVVDEVLNEQEVLVKNMGRPLLRVRNIAAATILGSGKVVPILNVADLLKSALQAPGRQIQAALPEQDQMASKSVLVVEDSITARSLLKGILEMAGYRVSTAVDGLDGLTRLRSGEFDMVVSDVEMPRMDGFDLTARIRNDKKLAELPVILVTALESREDRERGIDVGANAYIVKHDFEQSKLLEVMRRLI